MKEPRERSQVEEPLRAITGKHGSKSTQCPWASQQVFRSFCWIRNRYVCRLYNPNFSGDGSLDRAGKVVRLLHLLELKHLQGDINEVIAAAQEITADPQTDVRLGKVGR